MLGFDGFGDEYVFVAWSCYGWIRTMQIADAATMESVIGGKRAVQEWIRGIRNE